MKLLDRVKTSVNVLSGKKIRLTDANKIKDGLMSLFNSASVTRNATLPQNNTYAQDSVLSISELENIYLSSWIGKKVVELPVEFIWKNGFVFSIKGMPELEKKVLDEWNIRGMEKRAKKAMTDCGIYGGSVMFIKNPAQKPTEEFDPALLAQNPDEVDFIPIDTSYIAVTPHTNIIDANYFSPKTISIAGVTADHTNTILFTGIDVPVRRRPAFKYLGMSIYQNIYQALIMDDMVSQGVANMVFRNNRWYYGIEGLNDIVKQGNGALLLTRLTALENSMTLYNAGVIDKNDSVNLISQSFGSLPEIDLRSIERLAAATNIPATVLLGKSPDGMNATGESDLENLYNHIESQQNKYKPQVKQMFECLIYMYNGGEMVEFEFEWNKPNQLNIIRQAEVDGKIIANAQAMQGLGIPEQEILEYLVDKGLITTEQASKITLEAQEMVEFAEGEEAEGDESEL